MISLRQLIQETKTVADAVFPLKISVTLSMPPVAERWIGSLVLPSGSLRGQWTLKDSTPGADNRGTMPVTASIHYLPGGPYGSQDHYPDPPDLAA